MKKIFLSIILALLLCVSLALTACAPKTEYDDKVVVRIETAYYGGYVAIDSLPTRTFDFEAGTVTDELVLDDAWMQILLDNYIREPASFPEYENYDAYEEYLKDKYNNPIQIATFSNEDAESFLKKIKFQGIYTWKDRYDTGNVDDYSRSYVEITFSDGTVKRTDFYYDKPANYKRIQKSFKNYLNIEMMWNGSYIMPR